MQFLIDNFWALTITGLTLGAVYALVALGYSMVFGIIKLLNFAHGDIYMLGAFAGFATMTAFGISNESSIPLLLVIMLLSMVTTGLIGVGIERIAYRPLRNAPKISLLISAIGASYLLENLATVIFGGRPKSFPTPKLFTDMIDIHGVAIQKLTFYIPIVTIIFLAGLLYLINHTKSGIAMRAVAKDHETASIMGVNVNRIISLTFVIGSALAAVGGIMWGMKYPSIQPLMGVMPGLKAFIAAVIGGIGNVKGAVIGGFLLGIAEVMLVAFLPALSGYRDAFAFVLLIVILLVKPTGIIGEKIAEKV